MDAFEDYNYALTFSNDPEIYYQRGVLHQQLRNFRRGISDYNKHIELTTARTCQLYNNMGICQSHLGDIESAIISFRNAMQEDESFVDAFLNYAQMFKEIGDWEEAVVQYESTLSKFSSQLHLPQVEKNLFQLFYLRSVLFYSLGRPLHSLGDAKRHLGFIFENSNHTESAVWKSPYQTKDVLQAYGQIAMCFRNLGCYQDALKYYNLILAIEPENVCRVQKRIMLFYYSLLDSSPQSFNIDRDVDPRWKEIWSKGLAANGLDIPDSPLENEPLSDLFSLEDSAALTLTPQQREIFELARRFGPWVQIHSRGFLPNMRLHRGFGLAVLEMAQALKNNIDCIHRTGAPLMVPNAGSSQKYFAREGSHPFGYRDLFDIIVRWRQLSEPNDPVWWTDGLLRESFEEGFGLQTPMISGQLRCIRYYSYFKMGFEVLKSQAANQYYHASSLAVTPSKNAKKKIKKAATLKELHGIVGQDFYVVCPCHSIANVDLQTTVLEGTRLTVLKKEPEGFEFSIRCPSMPIRWKAMSDEITECYERTILSLYHQRYPEDNPHLAPSEPDPLFHGLQLFYYWTNFSPLTRGSAFCGYGVLFAIALAFGYQISSPIPKGKQLDWEAIFTSHPDAFIQNIKPQLTLEPFDVEEISTDGAMATLRDMYKLLHYGMELE
jgi:tetratricopeptide (TPR) repeat protein